MSERVPLPSAIVSLSNGFDAWVAVFDADSPARRVVVDEDKTILSPVPGLMQFASTPEFERS
jgi:hypothetical protein